MLAHVSLKVVRDARRARLCAASALVAGEVARSLPGGSRGSQRACETGPMTEISQRSVRLTRESKGVYVATNEKGGTLRFGPGVDLGFSPVELLLAAVAGCSGIDVDYMTSRR